jgi:NAD+ kinase
VLLAAGGDGTVLRALHSGAVAGAAVLGVNLGRLGFLAEIDVHELGWALSAIDERQFTVEPRSGLRAIFSGRESDAFNDIALARIPGTGTSAAVELRVEGHPFVRYAADAVIVATPTGSTAYSFSAGGPIVSPNAEGLLVTPVAPHSAFNRALFLSSGEKLALDVLPPSAQLAVDLAGKIPGGLTRSASSFPATMEAAGVLSFLNVSPKSRLTFAVSHQSTSVSSLRRSDCRPSSLIAEAAASVIAVNA